MPLPHHVETLHTIGRDILAGEQSFQGDIVPRIDTLAAEAAHDPFVAAKIRRVAVLGPLVQGMCGQAMSDIADLDLSYAPSNSGLEAYDQYVNCTAEIDGAASRAVMERVSTSDGILRDAFEYHDQQSWAIDRIMHTDPDLVRKHGKLVIFRDPKATAVDVAAPPLKANADSMTMAFVVAGALRICLREGALPDSRPLANELRGQVIGLANGTRLVPQVFDQLTVGRENAQKIARQFRDGDPDIDDFSLWPTTLRGYLQSETIDPRVAQFGPPLLEEMPFMAASEKPRVHGHCVAQFSCQPDEIACFSEAYPSSVGSYFADQGIKLPANRFRAGDYQLTRGIEVAEQTIFQQSDCRLAFEALAEHIRSSCT